MAKAKKTSAKTPVKKIQTVEDIEAQIEALQEQKEQAEAKSRAAAKPKLTPDEARLQKGHDELYEKHKKEIDKELERCTGHLRKLDIEVAREVIRRLEDYYLKHGIN